MSALRGNRRKWQGLAGLAVAAAVALATLAGCGNTLYAIQVNSASNKIEQAKKLGAEKLAPYEYYYAVAHLDKAMSEAADADYSDATDFAEVAEEYADKAIRLASDASRNRGR